MRTVLTRQPRTAGTTTGFTLLELILVMLLISTMLAIAVPSLRGFVANSKQRDAIAQLVALAQFAKARSAADAKVYRLNLAGSTYWLTMQEGESYVPIGTDMGRTFELPSGMHVEAMPAGQQSQQQSSGGTGGSSVVLPAAPGNADGVSFYPEGRTDTALFRLTDAAGNVTFIGCSSPAESFRVVSAEEAARL